MGGKMSWGKEGTGCDDVAAAAPGTSGDSGGGAPSPSTSATPLSPAPTPSSPSPPQSPRSTPSSPSPPQSPTPTPSSTSFSDEEYLWGEEQDFDQPQEDINITYSQEDVRREEHLIDGLQNSLGTTHLSITHSEIQNVEKGDTGEVLNSKSNLGDKESVLTLDNYSDDIITGQIVLLSKKYGFFRRIAGDGSCFYRAFLFSYLENVVETNDEAKRKAEAARLRQRVEKYMLACHDECLLYAFCEFESVVNLIEQGLASGELYHMEKNQHVTSQILPLLRSLTEIEICSREDFYHAFLGGSYESVFELCFREVRPSNGEANHLQITALVNALGIPIILENLDKNTPGRLNSRPIYPRQEFEAEALEQEQSVDSDDSTTPMAQVEHDDSADRSLSPAERRRLVTLLYRPGHYDIIYPK